MRKRQHRFDVREMRVRDAGPISQCTTRAGRVTIGLVYTEEKKTMTNQEYDRTYWGQRLQFKFCPTPRLREEDLELIIYARASQLRCPRLPRPGEAVLTRAVEDALAQRPWSFKAWHAVVAVGELNGVSVEALLDDGTVVRPGLYGQTWRWVDGQGPAEVLS
jgi:hypothetical protein